MVLWALKASVQLWWQSDNGGNGDNIGDNDIGGASDGDDGHRDDDSGNNGNNDDNVDDSDDGDYDSSNGDVDGGDINSNVIIMIMVMVVIC